MPLQKTTLQCVTRGGRPRRKLIPQGRLFRVRKKMYVSIIERKLFAPRAIEEKGRATKRLLHCKRVDTRKMSSGDCLGLMKAYGKGLARRAIRARIVWKSNSSVDKLRRTRQ